MIELIKNSHDADASYVKISFVPPLLSGDGSIIIEDDGHGMTLDDIQQKWMEPATSEKANRRQSPKGRRLLGSKGIGRFAAARLGQLLALESTGCVNTVGALFDTLQTTVIPEVDWNAFEGQGYLDAVNFLAHVSESKKATGTVLTISRLRDPWTPEKIEKLHRELRRLLSPVEDPTKASFKIYLDFSKCTVENCGLGWVRALPTGPEHTDADHSGVLLIRPFPVLEAADYSIDGLFDTQGTFEGNLVINKAEAQTIPISWTLPLQTDNDEASCGVVLVKFHVFDRESEAVRATASKAGFGGLGLKETRRMLDDVAGVAIYREGFRIRPYGDASNDWLSLDAKRVQNPTMRIGRNQIAGIVTIDAEESSKLIERSSREGLEENGSFRRLTALISALLSEIVEPHRRRVREAAGIEKAQRPQFSEAIEQAKFDWVNEVIGALPAAQREQATTRLRQESGRLLAKLGELENLQARLQAQVTLGEIIGEVRHQGNTSVSYIETESLRLQQYAQHIVGSLPDDNYYRKQYHSIAAGIVTSASRLRVLFEILKPLSGGKRGAPQAFNIRSAIENIVSLFRQRIEANGIKVEVVDSADKREIVGYQEDIYHALVNLVDNAVFWLVHHKIPGPTIVIELGDTPGALTCTVSDNGVGIPAAFQDSAFDVGFSLKPQGTGLGLTIAREAIQRSGGKIELLTSTEGAKFRISIPSANAQGTNSYLNINN